MFVVSGLKIIGHGNPDNNLESLCTSVVIFRSKTNHIPGKNEHILLPLINCFRVRR
jgi:hypothetical protein